MSVRSCAFLLPVLVACVVLAGCATTTPPAAARIERMTPEQLAAIRPQANPVVPLAEVVALSVAGTPPADIIKRMRDTQTVHLLTPQQIVELSRQGVDQAVIDYLADAQEKARQARLLTELADRDAAEAKKLANETQRRRAAEQSYYGYGGFSYGYPGYRPGWPAYPGYFGSPFPYSYRRWR
jgi:hypothetical protein